MQEPFKQFVSTVNNIPWCERCRQDAPIAHMPQDCINAVTAVIYDFLTDGQKVQTDSVLNMLGKGIGRCVKDCQIDHGPDGHNLQ